MSTLKFLACAAAALAFQALAAGAAPPPLATVAIQSSRSGQSTGFDGVVEAVRQTVVAAQVSGAIVALDVKVGDMVKAGQVLARIDARAADMSAAASAAQVQAARASLDIATKDFERHKQLFQRSFISQAALDQAESRFKSTQAQVTAQLAQAGATRTQSGFFVVKAPYAGVVSELPVALGDMAMPGRALLTVYDPKALRVAVSIPQSWGTAQAASAQPKVQIPALPAARQWITPARVMLLPVVDAATHTVELRLDLPAGTEGITPGMFARTWLPSQGVQGGQGARAAERLYAPAQAVVRRAEMTGLYVIDAAGRPLLRQVRVGRATDDSIEILSGVSAGERVALDPQAAARVR